MSAKCRIQPISTGGTPSRASLTKSPSPVLSPRLLNKKHCTEKKMEKPKNCNKANCNISEQLYSKTLNTKFRTVEDLRKLFQNFLIENSAEIEEKKTEKNQQTSVFMEESRPIPKEKTNIGSRINIEEDQLKKTNSNNEENEQKKIKKFKNIIRDYFDKDSRFPCCRSEFIIDMTEGHFTNITSLYSLGKYIISGSLDTTIRVWDAASGTSQMVLRGHLGRVSAFAHLSNENNLILFSASFDLSIKVWDLETKKEIFSMENAHSAEIRSISILQRNKNSYLLSGGEDKEIIVWFFDVESFELSKFRWFKPKDVTFCIVHAPHHEEGVESEMIFSSGKMVNIQVFQFFMNEHDNNNNNQSEREIKELNGHTKEVTCLAISPDQEKTWLVSGSEDSTIRVWNLKNDFALVHIFNHHTGGVLGLFFAPPEFLEQHENWFQILSYDRKNEIKASFFPKKKDNNLQTTHKTIQISNKTYSDLSRYRNVLVANSEHVFRPEGEDIKCFNLNSNLNKKEKLCSIQESLFNPPKQHQNLLMTEDLANENAKLSPFKHATSLAPNPLKKRKETLSSLMLFTPDSRHLIFTYLEKYIYIQDLSSKAAEKIMLESDHRDAINCLVLSMDASKLISADQNGRIEILDLKTRERTMIDLSKHYEKGLILSQNQRVIFAGKNKLICQVDLSEQKSVEIEHKTPKISKIDDPECISFDGQPHIEKIGCFTTTNDTRTIISGSDDGQILLWDVSSKRRTAVLDGHLGKITYLFMNNEKNVLLSVSDREIIQWDLRMKQQIFKIEADLGPIIVSNFNFILKQADNKENKKNLEIIEVKTQKVVGFLERDNAPLTSLGLSPDNTTIVAGFANDTIYVWEVSKPSSLELEQAHSAPVQILESIGDKEIVSFGGDNMLRIWDLAQKTLKNEIPLNNLTYINAVPSNNLSSWELIVARKSLIQRVDLSTGSTTEGRNINSGVVKCAIGNNHVVSCGHSQHSLKLWFKNNAGIFELLAERKVKNEEKKPKKEIIEIKAVVHEKVRFVTIKPRSLKYWWLTEKNELKSERLKEKTEEEEYKMIRVDGSKKKLLVNSGRRIYIWPFNEDGIILIKELWDLGEVEEEEIRDFDLNSESKIVVFGKEMISVWNCDFSKKERGKLWKMSIGVQNQELSCFLVREWNVFAGDNLGNIFVWEVKKPDFEQGNFFNLIESKEKKEGCFELQTKNLKYDVRFMSFSENNKRIFTFCSFFCIVWDAETKKRVATIKENEYSCHASNSNGTILLIGTKTGLIKFWEIHDPQLQVTRQRTGEQKTNSAVFSQAKTKLIKNTTIVSMTLVSDSTVLVEYIPNIQNQHSKKTLIFLDLIQPIDLEFEKNNEEKLGKSDDNKISIEKMRANQIYNGEDSNMCPLKDNPKKLALLPIKVDSYPEIKRQYMKDKTLIPSLEKEEKKVNNNENLPISKDENSPEKHLFIPKNGNLLDSNSPMLPKPQFFDSVIEQNPAMDKSVFESPIAKTSVVLNQNQDFFQDNKPPLIIRKSERKSTKKSKPEPVTSNDKIANPWIILEDISDIKSILLMPSYKLSPDEEINERRIVFYRDGNSQKNSNKIKIINLLKREVIIEVKFLKGLSDDHKDFFSALLVNSKQKIDKTNPENIQIITGSHKGVISIRNLKKILNGTEGDSDITNLHGHSHRIEFLKMISKEHEENVEVQEEHKHNWFSISNLMKTSNKNISSANKKTRIIRTSKAFSVSSNLTLRIWDLDLMVCCMVIEQLEKMHIKIEALSSNSKKCLAFDGRNIIDFKNDFIISTVNRNLSIDEFFLNNNEVFYKVKKGLNDDDHFNIVIVPILNFLGGSKNFLGLKNHSKDAEQVEMSIKKNYSIPPFDFNLLHIFSIFENLQEKEMDLNIIDYKNFLKLKLSLHPFLSVDYEGKTCFDYLLMNNSKTALKSLFQVFFTALQTNIDPFFQNHFYLKAKFFSYDFSSSHENGFLDFLLRLISIFEEDTEILDHLFQSSFVQLDSTIYKKIKMDLKDPVYITTKDFGWLNDGKEVKNRIQKAMEKKSSFLCLLSYIRGNENKEIETNSNSEVICSVILMKGITRQTSTTCEIMDRILDLNPSNRIFSNQVLGVLIDYKWNSYARNKYMIEGLIFMLFFLTYLTNFVYIYPLRQEETIPKFVETSTGLEITAFVFFLNHLKGEYRQFAVNGWRKYFASFWNWVDLMVIVGTLGSLVLDFITINQHLLPYPLKIVVATTLLFLWAKMLTYSRGIKGTGFLIRLVEQVVIDIRYFVIMMFLFVLAFASSGYILQMNYEFSQFDYFTVFYRLTLGDYGKFDDISNGPDIIPLWLLMVIITLVLTIIMLNLLISIIGSTYDRVFEAQYSMRNLELLSVIQEIDKFKILQKRMKEDWMKNEDDYLLCFHNSTYFNKEETNEDHILEHIHELNEKIEINSQKIDVAFKGIEELKKNYDINSFRTNQSLEEIKTILQVLDRYHKEGGIWSSKDKDQYGKDVMRK